MIIDSIIAAIIVAIILGVYTELRKVFSNTFKKYVKKSLTEYFEKNNKWVYSKNYTVKNGIMLVYLNKLPPGGSDNFEFWRMNLDKFSEETGIKYRFIKEEEK